MERPDDILTRIAVRAILVDDEGKVLLTKRSQKDYEGGRWCLAGGKPDENESLESAVVRETAEEIGFSFIPTSCFAEIENSDIGSGERWITHYFIGNINVLPTDLQDEEVEEIGLFSREEIQNMDNIAFDHKAVLTRFFEEALNK